MIKNALSKTQIDRLGDRLKEGPHTEMDLRLLDDYRRSFGDAYKDVVRIIRERDLSPTGRSAKSISSIVEKLRRESIRLTQIQDIAGCRVVVPNVMEQERVVASLGTAFAGASVMDRRDNPSYGYRAVHIIAKISGKPVEIQIRTSLQHKWAELSEKSSDVLDPRAAYKKLETTLVTAYENLEATLLEQNVPGHMAQEIRAMLTGEKGRMQGELTREKGKMQEDLASKWNETAESLNKMISWLDERRLKGQKQ